MLPGLVIKYFSKDRMGTFVGAVSSVLMFGMMAGAPLAGWLYDMQGSYRMAWLIMGTMLMVMTFIFFFLLQRYADEITR